MRSPFIPLLLLGGCCFSSTSEGTSGSTSTTGGTYPVDGGCVGWSLSGEAGYPVAAGMNGSDLAAGDLTGSGSMDLVVAPVVSVLLNNGDGVFDAGQNAPPGVPGGGVSAIAVMPNDAGRGADLAYATLGAVGFLINQGDGLFSAPPAFATAQPVINVLLPFALHGGPALDLVGLAGTQNEILIFGGLDGGVFGGGALATISTQARPTGLASADFNGDGLPDLVVIYEPPGPNAADLFLNLGDGGFAPAQTYTISDETGAVAVGDFNGDGLVDIAISTVPMNGGGGNTIDFLMNQGGGTFAIGQQYNLGYFAASGLAVGDLNGDGALDLAFTNGGTLWVALNDGGGTFLPPRAFPAGTDPRSVVVADFNSDGLSDVAIVDDTTNNVGVFLSACLHR